ncbi:unnamed protein product, partial [Iphiclides podalirius]
MTLSERENAAVLLQNTTANPFTYLSYPFSFRCFYCPERSTELGKILAHTKAHVVPELSVLMTQHLRKGKKTIKADISELLCRICDAPLSSLDEARGHLSSNHGERFTEAGNGIIAFGLKTTNGEYSCRECSETFHGFFQLNKHINVHYSAAVCDTCGKAFATHARLLQHMETHLTGRYPCEQCGRTFTSPPKLRYHASKAHGGQAKVKPSKCPVCDARFEHHYEKMKHLREMHGIAHNHPCKACGAVFTTRKSLYFHTRKQHTSALTCEVCDRPFAERNHLKKHMAVHTHARDHPCPLCSKAYRYEKNLKEHMRVHNPDWRFACPRCWVGFRGKIEYRKHMVTHE